MAQHTVRDRSQVIPFPEANDLQLRISRSFALLNDFHAAVSGRSALGDVLAVLSRQTDALNIAMYRLSGGRAHPIAGATHALLTSKPEVSSGKLASYLRDTRLNALVPGSIWRLSRLRQETSFARSSAAAEWNKRPEVNEVSLVILHANTEQIDAIEMIFDQPPKLHPQLHPSLVTIALAEAWALRVKGLAGRIIRSNGRSQAMPERYLGGDILTAANPCGLSRAELRVCELLAIGTKAKDIAATLELSVPTIRTHLRNIYAKTSTSGQLELITVINDSRQASE